MYLIVSIVSVRKIFLYISNVTFNLTVRFWLYIRKQNFYQIRYDSFSKNEILFATRIPIKWHKIKRGSLRRPWSLKHRMSMPASYRCRSRCRSLRNETFTREPGNQVSIIFDYASVTLESREPVERFIFTDFLLFFVDVTPYVTMQMLSIIRFNC